MKIEQLLAFHVIQRSIKNHSNNFQEILFKTANLWYLNCLGMKKFSQFTGPEILIEIYQSTILNFLFSR